jgi:hypothetical protein
VKFPLSLEWLVIKIGQYGSNRGRFRRPTRFKFFRGREWLFFRGFIVNALKPSIEAAWREANADDFYDARSFLPIT